MKLHFSALFFAAITLILTTTAHAQICEDTCPYAFDGECDDGGPDSLYDYCDFGTDCGDCGPRFPDPGLICEDSCSWAFDGECDDGGPGSLNDMCGFGTDCGDCGPRVPGDFGDPGPGPDPLMCDDSCPYAFDGECDDGGPGSLYDYCDLGTDCGDCGPRDPHAEPIQPLEVLFCDDTCPYAFDGECDDGGPGSLYDYCDYGSDCGDCGPRSSSIPAVVLICEDTCMYAFDGECDDGGPDSLYDYCPYGSDCGDCGPRMP